ncbi:ATP citrate lyase beta subunit, partial [Suillus variegatus]
MVAGGGASVVYSDAIAAAGFAHELTKYGEYSGAPSEGQTFEYAKTTFDLLTRPPHRHHWWYYKLRQCTPQNVSGLYSGLRSIC